jgi:hypothetical protein
MERIECEVQVGLDYRFGREEKKQLVKSDKIS